MTYQLGDFGAARAARRTELQAAIGEARGDTLPLFFTPGKPFAVLPPELPVDALAPLLNLTDEVAYLIKQVLEIAVGENSENVSTEKVIGTFIDLLVLRPTLPTDLIQIAREVGDNILTPEGMAAFMAERPYMQDVGELAKTIVLWFRPGLGKLASSWTPSNGGGTSKGTSSGSTASTPVFSSPRPPVSPAPAVVAPGAAVLGGVAGSETAHRLGMSPAEAAVAGATPVFHELAAQLPAQPVVSGTQGLPVWPPAGEPVEPVPYPAGGFAGS